MLSFSEFIQEGSYFPNPIQPWCPAKTADPAEIYREAREKVDQMKGKFVAAMKRASSGSAKVLMDIKSEKSFLNKTQDRGKNPCTVHDLLRGAILTKTDEEAQAVVDALKKQQKWHEIEAKTKGGNEFGYYGSHHLKIVIDDIICEVQVMTQRLWAFKGWGHEIYNQTRTAVAQGGILDPKTKQLSKQIFSLGNKPKFIGNKKKQ